MPLESKVFIQGMNGDSEERFLEDAEYRYALNVRSGSSDNDNEGAIENVKGNTLVALSLPPGLNTCIGALEDKDERKVYYFLHNSISNHSIAEYDAKNNVAEVLYISSELGFDLEYLITGANIIDDRILKWTDDYTEPKELDIIRIKNRSIKNRSSNQNLSEDQYPNSGEVSDEQLISAIKYAPLAPPTAEYSNDYTIKYNNLFGKLFQFRYQYVYLNNEKSAWSPISKLEIAQGDSEYQNKQYVNPQKNNSIVLTVNGGSRLVKQVNFAVREGNLGDFYIAEELTKKERIQVGNGWDIKWRFNNDTINLPITRAESLKLYDDVPLLAKSQDLIDGNRLAYGNVVNGFDQVETDVNVSPVYLGNQLDFIAPSESEIQASIDQKIIGTESKITDASGAPTVGPPLNTLPANLVADPTSPGSGFVNTNINGSRGTFTITEDIEEGDIIRFTIQIQSQQWKDVRRGQNRFNTVTQCPRNTQNLPGNQILEGFSPPLSPPPILTPSLYNTTDSDGKEWSAYYGPSRFVSYDFSYVVQAGDTKADVFNAYVQALSNNATINPKDDVFQPSLVGIAPVPASLYSGSQLQTPDLLTVAFPGGSITTSTDSITLNLNQYMRYFRNVFNSVGQALQSLLLAGQFSWQSDFWAYTFSGFKMTHIKDGGDIRRTFKVGAPHKFALAYSDRAGRLSTAMRKDNMTVDVDWYSDIPSGDRGVVGMDLEINHEAPEWADYYHVLYSKNTLTRRYLQAVIKFYIYDPVTRIARINIDSSTIDFKNTYPQSVVSYDFAKGDRIRWVKQSQDDEGSYYNQYIDVEITGVYEDVDGFYTIESLPPSFQDSTVSSGVVNDLFTGNVVEIYTPLKEVEEGFYYEIGESFPVVDGKHYGNTDAETPGQNQTDSQPAIVRLRNQGDVYWRFRQNVITLSQLSPTFDTGGFIEDPSVSDFYISNFTNEGRFNLVDPNAKRTRREATIYYSEKFIPETNINGLSSFFLESFNEYDKEKGSIQKLYSEDRTLLIFQELKVGMVMVNTAVFNDLSGQGLIGQSTNVLSDIQYYSGEYGISRVPESFAVYGNNKYFSDVNRGVVCRLGANGITPISDNKMHNYFNDTFNEISKNKTNPRVIGEYDKRFEEYIISIRKEETYRVFRPSLSNGTVSFNIGEDAPECFKEGAIITLTWDVLRRGSQILGQSTESAVVSSLTPNPRTDSGNIISFNQSDLPTLVGQLTNEEEELEAINIIITCYNNETLAFSENILKWSTFYGYEPDYIIENGVDIISFKNGNLYTHNTNDIYNNFYGEQQDSRIEVISKENPRAIKFYKNIEEESTTPWDMIEGKNQVGQSTNLIKEDFETIESHHYAAFWKDINTPNIDNPLIEGEDMRSYTMSLLLRNDSVTLEKLFSIGIRYEVSELSGK
jgi:hypothetical protein